MRELSEIASDVEDKGNMTRDAAESLFVIEKALRYSAVHEEIRRGASHSDIQTAARYSDEANMLEEHALKLEQAAYELEQRVNKMRELRDE